MAGALLAFTIAFYVLVYTMWLKRRTPQNIVIGGAAGAFPPMIGWAAATGSVGIESVVLFLIIFMWTPPHFWALALYRARDYERAGVPMLPVVAGPEETRKQIVIYSALLVPLALTPAFIGIAGGLYALARDRARRDLPGAGPVGLPDPRGPRGRSRGAGSCSPSPSSTCSGCSPCFSSNEASIDWRTDRGGSHGGGGR